MTTTFICKNCGNSFSLAPAVLARYPGWTPPLCMDCREKTPGRPAPRSTPKRLDLPVAGPQTGVFTDGACEGNPGPGGWGAVKVIDGTIVTELSGASPQTTNNRMELMAMIEGLKLLDLDEECDVFSDSSLVVSTVNSWAENWRKNGWTRGAKHEPIANLELVQQAFEMKQSRPKARVQWIKGHAGYDWNEYVDRLAHAYQSGRVTNT